MPSPFHRLHGLPPNLRGALWMMASAVSFSLVNVLVKDLGQSFHSIQLGFLRFAFGLLPLLPVALVGRGELLRVSRPGLHILRGLMGTTTMFLLFYAITKLPLATMTAAIFARSLFVIPLSVLLLGEIVHWRRWTATIVGFGGVLIMLHPRSAGWGLPVAAALGSTALMGAIMILVKKMTHTEKPVTMLFWFSVIGTLGALPLAIPVWRTPEGGEWAWLLVMGVLATVGQFFMVRAYRVGEASAVTPMDYTQLLFATLFGITLFGEVPDMRTAVGALIVSAATFYIMRRESRIGRG